MGVYKGIVNVGKGLVKTSIIAALFCAPIGIHETYLRVTNQPSRVGYLYDGLTASWAHYKEGNPIMIHLEDGVNNVSFVQKTYLPAIVDKKIIGMEEKTNVLRKKVSEYEVALKTAGFVISRLQADGGKLREEYASLQNTFENLIEGAAADGVPIGCLALKGAALKSGKANNLEAVCKGEIIGLNGMSIKGEGAKPLPQVSVEGLRGLKY